MDLSKIYKWYWRNDVKFKIVSYLYRREFAFLPAKITNADQRCVHRMLRVHNVQSFDFIKKRFNLFWGDRIVNFYYSLARFKDGIPKSDLSCPSNYSRWNELCSSSMDSFDFLVDIDAPAEAFDFAIDSAVIIKKLFDDNGFPYSMRFSGRGFHFVTPYRYFEGYNKKFDDDDNICMFYSRIASKLQDFSSLVDIMIYDKRRLVKVPYSVAVYDEGAYVNTPIVSLDGFSREDYNLDKFGNGYMLNDEMIFNSNGGPGNLLKNLGVIK